MAVSGSMDTTFFNREGKLEENAHTLSGCRFSLRWHPHQDEVWLFTLILGPPLLNEEEPFSPFLASTKLNVPQIESPIQHNGLVMLLH